MYFGLHPKEATELTVAEMALFIKCQRRRQRDEWRMLAQVGYSGGIVGSMSLSKSRPKFEELFNFPVDEEHQKELIERSRKQMIAWAANVNRLNKKGV